MGKASDGKKEAVDAVLTDFMTEFARCLVAAGVTSSRFSGIAKVAFFSAAIEQARFGNDRLNQSAVAAMTGLTRNEVRRLAKESSPKPPTSRDRVDALIDGWSTDSAFVTSTYQPRRLRLTGEGVTFGELVQRYGGDIPPRSMLRELQRNGLVTISGGTVSLNSRAQRTREEVRFLRVARALAGLLRKPTDGCAGQLLRTTVLEVNYRATSPRGRPLLQRRINENLAAFMTGIQAVGAAAALEFPLGAAPKRRFTRTRVALITEDVE